MAHGELGRGRRARVSALRGALGGLAIAAAAGCGPVPGGSLSGRPAPLPPDWASKVGERAFCEIESRPRDPHSIQLECFVDGGDLFVQSHRWALASWWPVASWAGIWLEEPDVRVRLDDEIFDVRAVRESDAARRERILHERGYDPVPEGIVLFRFEPRG
jgi:hypothetical protein